MIVAEEINFNADLISELLSIGSEYDYYGNKYDDGAYFPQERQQKLLQNLEDNYLKKYSSQQLDGKSNPLGYVSNVPFAKLFFYYGGNPFDKKSRSLPLSLVASQQQAQLKDVPDFSHDEIIEIIKNRHTSDYWISNLPSNNAIQLVKLYIGLGADIHADAGEKQNTLDYSLRLYRLPYDEHEPEIYPEYIKPDEKDFSHQTRKEIQEGYGEFIKYYKSKVTYWLEEFIEADYPVSMLDTHRLHYPRFMKEASVAEVMDMLNNSDAHKISANINCPYKDTCPLTPSVNMRDAMGRTPLHIAGEQGNQAVFDALIQIGADESIKDYRGNLARY